MIRLDKITYLTIELALFSSYTMGFGDVEKETGYTKKQFEEVDNKYADKDNYNLDEVDLPVIIKALEWMLIIRDESELLGITNNEGLNLLDLLKQRTSEIKMEDWCHSHTQRAANKKYYGDTAKGNVLITTDKGDPTVFPNSKPSEYIKKSSSKDLLLRNTDTET